MSSSSALPRFKHSFILPLLLCGGVFVIYLFSGSPSGSTYDYTFRLADALLQGSLGVHPPVPSAMNEFIPVNGMLTSAFPLGSVLTMVPLGLFRVLGIMENFPGVWVTAFIAGSMTFLFWLLSSLYSTSTERRIFLAIFFTLGTWMWANLAFGGAWQIALGFAVVGQMGALYFILCKREPFLAGAFFALAFGNRTEVLFLLPLFLFFLLRKEWKGNIRSLLRPRFWFPFCSVPFLLGVATLIYNALRFGSPFDFGYAHIPGVLDEPWYVHGIFSLHAFPANAREMLLTTWKTIQHAPYIVPTGFGGSILLCSPYLLFLFRPGGRDLLVKRLAWAALIILTVVLWSHGNPGGWQFSYRYAIELLPWMFLILLQNSPRRVSILEWILLIACIFINATGMYIFLWTNLILG